MRIAMKNPSEARKGGRKKDVDDSKKTILIYSPDLNLCFSLSSLFQDRYNVITTTNAAMLETSIKHYSADLLIVDGAPSEKMLGQLADLKRFNRNLPIIMLYVYSPSTSQLESIFRDHVDSVFYKPFDITALSKRIGDLLSA